MTLAPGQSLSFHEILGPLGPLGAGGMGEVYSARDTRLGREVAIKVLPDEPAPRWSPDGTKVDFHFARRTGDVFLLQGL